MLKVGITGGIGSGKTTICQVFEVLGIPVFYADAVAKQMMHTDEKLKQEIQVLFGEQSYTDEGYLDSKYLANIVFKDKKKLYFLQYISVFWYFLYVSIKDCIVKFTEVEKIMYFNTNS